LIFIIFNSYKRHAPTELLLGYGYFFYKQLANTEQKKECGFYK